MFGGGIDGKYWFSSCAKVCAGSVLRWLGASWFCNVWRVMPFLGCPAELLSSVSHFKAGIKVHVK